MIKPQTFSPVARPLALSIAMAFASLPVVAHAGTPYSGTPIAVPGTFEAEHFDKGGEGSGYHELSSANLGGRLRTSEAVDIIAASDSGNHLINNFQTGEWMAYTIDVAATGTYSLAIRASNNGSPAAFHIEVDGVNVTGSIPVGKTGSWDSFAWFEKAGVSLTGGRHVLKVVSDAQYFNIDSVRLQASTGPVGATAIPYLGTPVKLPGSFEAEHFDKGGEGVGYHDLSAGNTGGQLRTTEGVDIVASTDAAGGGHVVNNFQSGEWLAYTVDVPVAGKYDLAIRAANNGTPAAFHLEVDGRNVSGSVAVPKTGSWDTYDWFGKTGVDLAAGRHVIKLVADTQYFNVNTLRVQASAASAPSTSAGTPYSGTPIAVPLAFEAENFDKGGEGLGYHDLSPGNAGSVYRTSEAVDLIASADTAGGGYVVNNFQTGEWLAYTINVPAAGKYDLSIRAANNGSAGAYHFELDGVDVTGQVSVPNTGGWDAFAWFTRQGVNLAAGKHVLKLVSDAQYFNVNSLSVMASGASAPPPATDGSTGGGSSGIPSTGVSWSCDFENSYCGMSEHSKLESSGGRRSSFVTTARSNSLAVRLHTEPGDNNIHGSGNWERNDLMMSPSSSYCNQGQEEWWGHSVMFPSDYVFPPGPESGIIFDFHHNASSGQANFEIGTIPGVGMRLRGYGGSSINSGQYNAVVTDPYGAKAGVTRNKWYDFNYHVKWSSGSDGYMIAWLNGKKIMNYNGPTLYAGISCYLKLANYHAPFGQSSSVIHDRIVRGTSAPAVSLWTLE